MIKRRWVVMAVAVASIGAVLLVVERDGFGIASSARSLLAGGADFGEPVESRLLADVFRRRDSGKQYHRLPRGELEFNKHIAPVIYTKCAKCHYAGGPAPFALTSFSDVQSRAKRIARVVHRRLMPPWKPDPGFTSFRGDFSLSVQEKGMLEQWLAEGCRQGVASRVPPGPVKPGEWRLGVPDVILEPSEPFDVPAEGPDMYRCFVIPTGYDEDRYVRLTEVAPKESAVVHHAFVFADISGSGRARDAADPGPGFRAFGALGFDTVSQLGAYAPGMESEPLPDGVGYFLPKGADVIVQVHYHPSGRAVQDRSRIGLYFSDKPVDKKARIMPVAVPPQLLNIGSGEENATFWAEQEVPGDISIVSVMPHMHLLGREIASAAYLPTGGAVPIVRISDWDFRWQNNYRPETPLHLPKGTRLRIEARFDNSSGNPVNPNQPPAPVRFGLGTTDEMCMAVFCYTVDAESLTQNRPAAPIFPDSFLKLRWGVFAGGRKD